MTAKTLCERFDAIVKRQPGRVAIEVDGELRWRYAELAERTHSIARALVDAQIARGSVVAISLPKSAESVAALLGVWRAGCVALPLPPEVPSARRREILERTATTASIGDQSSATNIVPIDPSSHVRGAIDRTPAQPHELAYLLFTSGSTGRPKGVAVTHRGLVPLLEAQVRAFQLDQNTRSLFYLSLAFDASISDIGTAILAGGTLVVESDLHSLPIDGLLERMATRRISYADLPPALLSLAAKQELPVPGSLKTVVIGGEVCPLDTVKYWAARLRLVNVYGPTEATICTSLSVCDPESWMPGSIGKPIASATYHLEPLDPDDPATGELWIGGAGLAQGYWQEDSLTKERFVVRNGHRWYRTGDRVTLSDRGEYLFRGRLDRQFKLRGRLVEPAEIESQLMAMPEVAAAVVFPGTTVVEVTESIAFIGATIQLIAGASIDAEQILSRLRQQLPEWMLPQRLEFTRQIPLTMTGKPDLAAMKEAFSDVQSSTGSSAPHAPHAVALKRIWEQTLGRKIGWDDDFLLVGGDSLSALQIIALAQTQRIPLSIQSLLQARTIRGCLELCGQSDAMSTAELNHEVTLRGRSMSPSPCESSPPAKRFVLLTGSTGLLGTWVLDQLLQMPEVHVECLVRATNQDHALARMNASRKRFGGGWWRSLRLDDIAIVCGNITEANWGLQPYTWDRLGRHVTDIVHLAAEVHLLKSFSELRSANFEATGTAMELANQGCPKWLHDASTLSVFVASDRSEGCFVESDRLTAACQLYGGYGQTKWASEKLLWDYFDPQRLTVYRFGLLTGDSVRGIGASEDQLALFSRGLNELGVFPDGCDSFRFDATPVDQAALGMSRLIEGRVPGAFHLCGAEPISFPRWIDALRRSGSVLRQVCQAEFHAAVQDRLADSQNSPAATACLSLCRRLGLMAPCGGQRELDLFLATGVSFDARRTQAFFDAASPLSNVVDDHLLTNMAAQLLGEPVSELT